MTYSLSTPFESCLYKLFQRKSILQIKDIFDNYKYPIAIIKGCVLSNYIYGNPWSRISSDIDIMVSRKHVDALETLLHNLGYYNRFDKRSKKISLLANSHQLLPYIKEIPPLGKIIVDVNFDILWGEYDGPRIDIDNFLLNTVEMDIYGIKVKTLTPLKTMIQVALHHYKDMNSIFLLATKNSIRVEMFQDVFNLLMNNLESIKVDSLFYTCKEYGVVPYLFYILYYTNRIYNNNILKKYVEALRCPEGEELLGCYGLCKAERKEWKCDFLTRLKADSIFPLIKEDLSKKDIYKIKYNSELFVGL